MSLRHELRYGPLILLLFGMAPATGQAPGLPSPIRVVLAAPAVGDAFSNSAILGARLGAEEAARTAQLMAAEYRMDVVRFDGERTGNGGLALIDSAQIVISALDESAMSQLVRAHPNPLVLDLRTTTRSIECAPRLLYFPAAGSGQSMWNSDLVRFGGQQLNQRYTRATKLPMDDAAWLGWFATKVSAEIAMRAGTTSPDSLARYVRSRRARFDGQKGKPLAFDPATGALIQPLYEWKVAGEPSELKQSPVLPQCRPRAP